LTRECKGNVHYQGIVKITASDQDNKAGYGATNVADLTEFSRFFSADEPDRWVCYDFKRRRITPTHYSIRSCGNHHLKSWAVEGSTSGYHWNELDRQVYSTEMNAPWTTKAFVINYPEEVRMIRLRQIGLNQDENNRLSISGFEIFGELSE
jgi:hypothetical protein